MDGVILKKIIMTGGGTAGHVTPNIALISKLKEKGYSIEYIGSKTGIEKELIENEKIIYYGISSGKLRRYLSIKNFTDIFQILSGMKEANDLIKKIKPDVVFSKGGFVTVPVVIAAKMNKIPAVIHESDITMGLANKIAILFCNKICCSFPETLEHLPKGKAIKTGTPIREGLFVGKKDNALKLCGFKSDKPIILVMCGSLGSKIINKYLRDSLDELLKRYSIVHLCGKGNLDNTIRIQGYVQFEYITKELPDMMDMADVIVSRAGANSIYEFLTLKKPNLLIPLSKKASRGDQILNAISFSKQGFSKILEEENMTVETLVQNIDDLYLNRNMYIDNMKKSNLGNGVNEVIKVIESV